MRRRRGRKKWMVVRRIKVGKNIGEGWWGYMLTRVWKESWKI